MKVQYKILFTNQASDLLAKKINIYLLPVVVDLALKGLPALQGRQVLQALLLRCGDLLVLRAL